VGRRPRQVTPEERALWHQVVRDAQPLHPSTSPGAAELPPAKPPAETPASPAASAKLLSAAIAPPPRPPTSRRLDASRPVDLDRRTWLKLHRGMHPIDARLDLHGLSQAEAHAHLTGFLADAQQRGNRCVLVITGRGLRHGGTLRAMTPRWLDEAPNRPRVLSYVQAQLRHGGEGALYVLLRRRAPSGGA
jgi:DNA-nicking Smr family endonuclease